MVCQNQSIDDSTHRWRATCGSWCASGSRPGGRDSQVIDFLVARYGEFVLLKAALHAAHVVVVAAAALALIGVGLALCLQPPPLECRQHRRSLAPDLTERRGEAGAPARGRCAGQAGLSPPCSRRFPL